MKMRNVIGMLAAASITMAVNAEPFTYQGQLNDGGQPANGLYDISLQIKDAAVGGSVVGSGFAFANVDVVDGLFELEFDPGDIFDSSDVWLEITIDDDGNPVILSPLTKITATPKAQHAKVADIALNAPWTVAPGILTYGTGNDRVLINRSSIITGSEYFGVHGDIAGFVGMYVSGPADSRPFYGYSVDNDVNAYTYYDATSAEWRLVNNSTEALVVDAQSDVRASNDVYADSFQFNAPKTRRVAVSGDLFRPWRSEVPYVSFLGGSTGAYVTQRGGDWMLAPITFPDGARVTKMIVYCTDTSPGVLHVSLNAREHNGMSAPSVFSVSTKGLNNSTLQISDPVPEPSLAVIDYSARHYSLFVQGDEWPGTEFMAIGSVVIEYTIDEAR